MRKTDVVLAQGGIPSDPASWERSERLVRAVITGERIGLRIGTELQTLASSDEPEKCEQLIKELATFFETRGHTSLANDIRKELESK